MSNKIRSLGGKVKTLDVSVLGDPSQPTDYSKHDVAEAGGSSIQTAIDSGSEHVDIRSAQFSIQIQVSVFWRRNIS